MKPILAKSQCWCVDEEAKFVLKRSHHDFYRIELLYEGHEDRRLASEFGAALDQVLRYEKTPCPFQRGFHIELPESPRITYVPWKPKHRPISPGHQSLTESPSRSPSLSLKQSSPAFNTERRSSSMTSKISSDFESDGVAGKSREASPHSLRAFEYQSIKPKIGKYEILDKDHRRETLTHEKESGQSNQKLRSHRNTEQNDNEVNISATHGIRDIPHEEPALGMVLSQRDSPHLKPVSDIQTDVKTVPTSLVTRDTSEWENVDAIRDTSSLSAAYNLGANTNGGMYSMPIVYNKFLAETSLVDQHPANTASEGSISIHAMGNTPAKNANVDPRRLISQRMDLQSPISTTTMISDKTCGIKYASKLDIVNCNGTESGNGSTPLRAHQSHGTSNTAGRAMEEDSPLTDGDVFPERGQFSIRRNGTRENDMTQTMDDLHCDKLKLSRRQISDSHAVVSSTQKERCKSQISPTAPMGSLGRASGRNSGPSPQSSCVVSEKLPQTMQPRTKSELDYKTNDELSAFSSAGGSHSDIENTDQHAVANNIDQLQDHRSGLRLPYEADAYLNTSILSEPQVQALSHTEHASSLTASTLDLLPTPPGVVRSSDSASDNAGGDSNQFLQSLKVRSLASSPVLTSSASSTDETVAVHMPTQLQASSFTSSLSKCCLQQSEDASITSMISQTRAVPTKLPLTICGRLFPAKLL